jgi:hypothetical protein
MLPLVLTGKSGGYAIKAMSGRLPFIAEAEERDAHTAPGNLQLATIVYRR